VYALAIPHLPAESPHRATHPGAVRAGLLPGSSL